jgi:hypothetical protein
MTLEKYGSYTNFIKGKDLTLILDLSQFKE